MEQEQSEQAGQPGAAQPPPPPPNQQTAPSQMAQMQAQATATGAQSQGQNQAGRAEMVQVPQFQPVYYGVAWFFTRPRKSRN